MRAVIYTRVSNDQAGRSTSTADQERECRAICDQHGWTVADVLTDDDRGASRWSSKDRPAYRQLSEKLEPGDVLVTWEASRAQRDLQAYVQLRDLCADRGVRWFYSGRLNDLTTGDDRFTTGLDALLAEKEAEQIRDRVLRGKRSAAMDGKPAGIAPWGYRPVRDTASGRTLTWEPDPDRAPYVVEAVRRLLDGETLYAICKDFTDRGIPSRSGVWLRPRLRVMLSTPSYAGLRTHQGTVIGEGNWPALISVDDHHALLALLADPARRSTDRAPNARHLLTGIALCGVCGATVRYFGPKSVSTPRYQCSAHSCVARRADYVDDLVTEFVIAELARKSPERYEGGDPQADATRAEIAELRARLDSFTDQAADGGLSAAALARVEARLLPQIRAAEQKLVPPPSALPSGLLGPDAQRGWDSLDIVGKRRIVRFYFSVVINPSTAAVRQFNPDDIVITRRQG